jgi:hypothetical protein
MKPVEALWQAVMYCGAVDPYKPGAVIAKLPRETREALTRLTSEDALSLRPDLLHRRP